ncbi:replication initiation protein, RepL2 [Kitasatospora kifunensis]|uniref:DNA-binding MarR family transcriptional regulator n=1 Tax=Kitasatospora kifunensis TaxID=58351 RepID=A0A7W7W018_KITKI|nr:replication initiation protein, RepL2 [Kitasatospora kifunensis]MBB4929116.1 DNA-binding MarR family transcriptional regulator [Kitasatospora kifunensis]
MNSSDIRTETLTVLDHSSELAPNLRIVLAYYSLLPQNPAGAVVMTAKQIANKAGMKESTFSKARTALIEDGWLEESSRLAHVGYFRLTAKALGGRPTVVPLRPAG